MNKDAKMINHPYDVKPVDDGNVDGNDIYLAVGRALDAWEGLEDEIASLFAILVGVENYRGFSPAKAAYGAVIGSGTRMDMVKQAADTALLDEKNAGILKRIKDHMNLCGKYSARRNEIAHGRVGKVDISMDGEFIGDTNYYLAPPLYNSNKQRPEGRTGIINAIGRSPRQTAIAEAKRLLRQGTGKYKYSSGQIDEYRNGFESLIETVSSLIAELDQLWRDVAAHNNP